MTLPGWRDWVYSGKAFVAACLALYIAFWMDLPRPYWAMTTVYVVAQPLAGPTLSKAAYRLMGTVLGGIGAVLLVPNLATSPELLALGLSLWTGACLFLSLMDRRPHSYVFMLAGYTAPIIGFAAVDDPGAIFTTAVARVQEIGLGIVCAGLVGSIVMPRSTRVVFIERVQAWLHHATAWAVEVLDEPQDATPNAARARLAADAIEIDALASHLGFDPALPAGARGWAEMLRSRMLLLLPLTASIASRISALQPDGLTPGLRTAMAALRDWLAEGAPASAAGALRGAIMAASPQLGFASSWPDLVRASLATRLRELVDLLLDCAALQQRLLGARGPLVLALPDIDGARGTGARHADLGLALRSAVAAVVAMLAASTFWIATAWPEGSSLPAMAAVGCSFFATLDNPVRPQLAFAKWCLLSLAISAVYAYAILPQAQEYETLVLLLMPTMLVAGLLAANPATMLIGLAVAANMPALLALQGRYTGDFASFANAGLALVGGLWCGTVITSVARVMQPRWVARRLLRASYRSLARAAEQRGQGNRAVFASLMLDRAGQMAPRLAAGLSATDEMAIAMMAVVRIGLNVVDLRRARHLLPVAVRASLDAVLDGLAAEFTARAGSLRHVPGLLHLAVLDRALADAARLPPGTLRDDMLLGLVGVRLGLFPMAPGYVAEPGDRMGRAA